MVMAGGEVYGVIVANVNPSSFSCVTGGNVEMPAAANAARIVACVNACAGLSTDDLMNTGLVSAVGYQLIEKDAEIEQQQARIAELEARINILLEQRNRLGQDVQNAAITGVVPENHAIGAQLGLVANMRAKLAELARKAAHDVTLTNEGNITDRQLADAVNDLRKFHAAGQLRKRLLARGE